MEVLLALVCFVIFLILAASGFVAFVMVLTSLDVGIFLRAIRRGRFGLKTAFGIMALIGVTFGLATAMGVEFSDPGALCVLVVVIPLALFIVAFVGLSLSELFDAKSTRELVARRHQDDELAVYAKQRQEASEHESPLVDSDRGGGEQAGDRFSA